MCGEDLWKLLEASLDAQSRNAKAAEAWIYDESIVHQVQRGGSIRTTGSSDYEVFIIEGRPYYRLVRRNGRPLSARAAAAEQKRLEHIAAKRRAGRPSADDPDARRVRADIASIEDVARVWRDGGALVTEPKQPLPVALPTVRTRRYLDPGSGLPHRLEMEYLLPYRSVPAGSRVEIDLTRMEDGTWLRKRVCLRMPQGGKDLLTVQEYRNYRRFSAVSTVKPAHSDP